MASRRLDAMSLVAVYLTFAVITSQASAAANRSPTGRRLSTSGSAEPANMDAIKSYFKCRPCEPDRCSPVDRPGCELVRELGVCSCCNVCALQLGQSCGVFTEPCGAELKCGPPPGDDGSSVESLFYGEGVCRQSVTNDVNGGNFEVQPSHA